MDKTDVVDVVDSESRVKTRHGVKRGERTRGEERLSPGLGYTLGIYMGYTLGIYK